MRIQELSGQRDPGRPGRRAARRSTDDPDAGRAVGMDHAVRMSEQLLAEGAPCLHFYTFNRSKATIEVLTALGMAPVLPALTMSVDLVTPRRVPSVLPHWSCCSPWSPFGCPAGSARRRCCCTWASAWCWASTASALDLTNALLTEQLGFVALVFILAEGGLTTRWENVRPALGLGISLATVSVVVSIAVAGLGVHLLLGFDWRTSLLWGAVLSSTDAAAVFSVLRGVGVKPRLSAALELESGLNDAPVVIAVMLLAGTDRDHLVRPAAGGLRIDRRGDDRRRHRVRRSLAAAPGGPPGGRAVPAGDHRADRRRLRGRHVRARVRLPGGVRRCRHPRQLPAAAPGIHAVLRRGPWLAGADRPVRHARVVRRPEPAAGGADSRHRDRADRAAGRPSAVGDRRRDCRSGCPGGNRRSCPGRGYAARCRSCWR